MARRFEEQGSPKTQKANVDNNESGGVPAAIIMQRKGIRWKGAFKAAVLADKRPRGVIEGVWCCEPNGRRSGTIVLGGLSTEPVSKRHVQCRIQHHQAFEKKDEAERYKGKKRTGSF